MNNIEKCLQQKSYILRFYTWIPNFVLIDTLAEMLKMFNIFIYFEWIKNFHKKLLMNEFW